MALRGTAILPGMVVHFDISRIKSVLSVEKAMKSDQRVFLVAQKDADTEEPGTEDVYAIGTIAKNQAGRPDPEGYARILAEGLERRSFRL